MVNWVLIMVSIDGVLMVDWILIMVSIDGVLMVDWVLIMMSIDTSISVVEIFMGNGVVGVTVVDKTNMSILMGE